MIPQIDIGPLFGPPGSKRDQTDEAIYAAASGVGFMTVHGSPFDTELGLERRRSLLRLFSLPPQAQRALWKSNFEPKNPNLYRGWFPLESGQTRCREGFEIGPDVARSLASNDPDDLLYQPSVFPEEDRLPHWRAHAASFYMAAEKIGFGILGALSRKLCIPESLFESAFHNGISTLRLLRYPARDKKRVNSPELKAAFDHSGGKTYEMVTGPHFDTGLLTLLAGYGVPGLQAYTDSGNWIDVPLADDDFAVNFGGLLSRWTDKRIRATLHRVLSSGEERFSIPFFFEPRPDTQIAPLPISNASPFRPFLFGDHLWATTTQFPENRGLAHLRPPRGDYHDPWAEKSET